MGIKGLAKLLSDEAPEVREMTHAQRITPCIMVSYMYVYVCIIKKAKQGLAKEWQPHYMYVLF